MAFGQDVRTQAGRSGTRRAWPLRLARAIATPYRLSHGTARVMLVIGTVMVGIVVLVALFAEQIAPFGFAQQGAGGEGFEKLQPPSGEHPLGTNGISFDVLSRVVWGARTELSVVALSLLFSVVVGVLLGLIAGFVGGWLDRVLVLVMDALFAFPYLLLAIVISFLLSNRIPSGVAVAALAITVVYIPQYFRVVRNSAMSAKEATYVEAARASGAGPASIMIRYLFPNVVQSVPVIATLNAADAILTLAGLGFLGLGIQPTEAAEWGYDLNRAIADASSGIWWTALFPGLAIVWLVVGLTLIGEGLNETLNPTLRVRRLLPVVFPERIAEGARRRGDGDLEGAGKRGDERSARGEEPGDTADGDERKGDAHPAGGEQEKHD